MSTKIIKNNVTESVTSENDKEKFCPTLATDSYIYIYTHECIITKQ